MKITFVSEVEELDYEIMCLKRVAKEREFGQYLCTVESKLIGRPEDAQALRLELVRNYNIYAARMRECGMSVAATFHDAVYPGMDFPEIDSNADGTQILYGRQVDGQPLYVARDQMVAPPIASAIPLAASVPVSDTAPVTVSDAASVAASVRVSDTVPVNPVTAQDDLFSQEPFATEDINIQQIPTGEPISTMQTSFENASLVEPEIVPPVISQMAQQIPKQTATQFNQPNIEIADKATDKSNVVQKNKAEFAIGGIVLSVLGTLLILSGAIMLAVNFFDSTMQGLSLYAVCFVLFMFSELFIRRNVEKLSAVLTSLSIGGVFVVTLVNYFSLHIFGLPATLGILIVLSLGIGVFGYFRNSFLFALIGYFASFLSLTLLKSISNEAEVYMIFGIMFMAELLWIILPMKKHGRAFGIIQAFSNIFLTFWLIPTVVNTETGANIWLRMVILLSASFAIYMLTIMFNGIRYYKDDDFDNDMEVGSASALYLVTMIISSVLYGILFIVGILGMAAVDRDNIISVVISTSAVIIPAAIVAYVLYLKECRHWKAIVTIIAFLGVTCLAIKTGAWGGMIGAIVLMCGVSAFALSKENSGFKVVELLLKIYLFFLFVYQIIANYETPYIMRYVCMAGIVLAIAFTAGYKVPIQVLMTGALIGDISSLVPGVYVPIVIAAGLCISVALYHNIKWLKSDNMLGFDIPVLVALFINLMLLYIPYFRDDSMTVLVTVLLGLGVMVQFYMERYGNFMANQLLPLSLYVSFAVPIFRMEKIAVSIILMVIALASVSVGFILKQKAVRIYGLILSILVCLKIGFIDFFNSDALVKTVMFFVVGILVLVIAGVYIMIEKKVSKKA